jgi:DNA polymerase-3 subunit gamma/tau
MSYQVLALKYRPRTFDEVVGQSHVTTTLTNAIASDRVAHAILFTGPRGTGKTTIARILAKAMNCTTGPTPTPCNACKICTAITQGHCADVFEIDGASNNSVDQIRDLRENVTYMPSSAKYKIYIIDEVHMLSTAAFNALLKTLEEPPDHVMFIFATTEVHKIPATILSRCQRHDLGRISLASISDHLQDLCTREKFQVERQSLDLIAREADGSIRDGLSLLDRVLSAGTAGKIDHQSVLDGLGILDRQLLHDISGAIFDRNGVRLIDIIEQVSSSGIDLKKYYSDLILHFRNLNVIKICGRDSRVANITDTEKEQIFQTVSGLSPGFIHAILQTLLDQESLVKYSSHTKTAVEMVLLKLVHINPGAQIDKIISRLDLLVRHIDSGLPDSAGQASGSENPRDIYAPVQALPSDDAVREETPAPTMPEPQGQEPVTDLPRSRDRGHHLEQNQNLNPDRDRESAHEKPTWKGFLNKIEQSLPFMFALLSKGKAKEISPQEILVELKACSSFDEQRLAGKQQELQTMCKNFLGKELNIEVLSQKNMTLQPNKRKKERQARQSALNHPLVLEAKKIFDGEIINQ